MQKSLLDLLHAPPTLLPVDPLGTVILTEIDERIVLPHPRRRWERACIEVHQHTDGLWMWAVQFHLDSGCGSGYRVGPKWGRFAATRGDAIFHAAEEMREHLKRCHAPCKSKAVILEWLEALS